MRGDSVAHYRFTGKLGGGGMGIVYRAEDLRLGRPVAVKMLDARMAADPVALERFRREARVSSSLNHPNIATVYDAGEHEGQPYLVLELLEGQTLRERIAGGPLPLEQLLEWAVQIADALDAAHCRGMLHRDIKPANLFITCRGQAKVLDFGLAKSAEEVPAFPGDNTVTLAEAFTSPGHTPGTANYMSPEQARGEELDPRTDIFSLGAVLYEMATGRTAFPGSSAATIFDAILNRNPEPVCRLNPELPAELGRLIRHALEKDRKLRYQTAAGLRADLDRLRRDSSCSHAAVPVKRRRFRLFPTAAALAASVLAAAGWTWLHSARTPPTVP